MALNRNVFPGLSFPLGATVYPDGVNFSVFSKNANMVQLLLFDSEDHSAPTDVIPLDPKTNKTFYYWHCFIPGLKAGQLYAYRVHGPYDPPQALRFDGTKVLLDPYSRAIVSDTYSREAACHPGDNCAQAMKSVVVDPSTYDWEGDRPLGNPYSKTVIYELHVGGFTKAESSGVREEWRGTYRGLIEKIPYLKELGITAVELLPVQQFDREDTPHELPNYWGYAPVNFFAPHAGYASEKDPLAVLDEFRDMVKALHRANIEVILDVVFNHTAEGGEDGPTISFRGFENMAYYMLEPDNIGYKNYTGTGNTLNANHSIVRRMVRDCLRQWVAEMHVDGFRFDLASVLSRSESGEPLKNPPLLWEIESDPVLAPTKIIAEAWDIENFQLGHFIGDKWAEWNGLYRDDLRRFMRGDRGVAPNLVTRVSGSPDLFRDRDRNPNRSINFVTCHDGFTLNDLVSYNQKHNEANLEDNRDGTDANWSWNCGHEGPTDDPQIQSLRKRQIKNFLTLLLTSQGTPMLLMGDEVRRTQHGNNNAYCQDNTISWMDWRQVEREKELLEFVRKLIRFNLSDPYFQERQFWNHDWKHGKTVVTWHGTRIGRPDLAHHSHSLAWTLYNPHYEHDMHIIANAYWEPLTFELPPQPAYAFRCWHRIVDTSLPPGEDILLPSQAIAYEQYAYQAAPHSVVVLMSKKNGDSK